MKGAGGEGPPYHMKPKLRDVTIVVFSPKLSHPKYRQVMVIITYDQQQMVRTPLQRAMAHIIERNDMLIHELDMESAEVRDLTPCTTAIIKPMLQFLK